MAWVAVGTAAVTVVGSQLTKKDSSSGGGGEAIGEFPQMPTIPPAPSNFSSGIFQVGGKGNTASQVTAQATPDLMGDKPITSLQSASAFDSKILLIAGGAVVVSLVLFLILKRK